ncbi:hypothetical protein FH608_028700 [Nonomuraea phyllanthi]|uniref:Uncharacterized protein n=1 Tax=Nonomuraea phyllanthi TaxID=2219224 RepID=A0A5C4W4X7_9ACTN|nr:hypothetical protein [Nonomuraea phyllanthi]KAB8191928.1 hypothetical protein FH608_028700 [Nonomuraea phyllanthi]
MSTTPIADLVLVPDRHASGLIRRDGSAEGQCFPRFDGPPAFARRLGDEAGHRVIRGGAEGNGLLRSFWPVQALAMSGQVGGAARGNGNGQLA